MADSYKVGNYVFDDRETYELASKEWKMIEVLESKADLSDPKVALKVYNKFVSERTFVTIIGQGFLKDLRSYIVAEGMAAEEALQEIPIRRVKKKVEEEPKKKPVADDKNRLLYEGQKHKNKMLKIAIGFLLALFAAFVIVIATTDYSVFTFFTNYKATMEEELVNKYAEWDESLKKREEALYSAEDAKSAESSKVEVVTPAGIQ